jgi:hypothetical protein
MSNIYKPTVNPVGIEGDDLPYHVSLLNCNAGMFDTQLLFWPLVDHYNTHDTSWHNTYIERAKKSKTVIFYDLVNTGDYEHTKFCEFISNFDHPHKIYLTVNQSRELKLANVEVLHWDFMWNRYRSYYTETIPYNSLYLHHYSGPTAYQLPVLDFDTPRDKKFLSMTGREFGYRTNLYEYVKDFNDGYVSNRSRGITIEGTNIVGAFEPVPNKFYLDSYISVYCESNFLQTNLIHVTEKTFEPLVKGHIILPFSNPGTIARLENMGFRMPLGVDYSFDSIIDPQQRFTALTDEFQNLMMKNLPKLYKDNQAVFIHNQACINNIGYDDRILKLYNV